MRTTRLGMQHKTYLSVHPSPLRNCAAAERSIEGLRCCAVHSLRWSLRRSAAAALDNTSRSGEATKAKLKEHLTNLNQTVLAERKSIKITVLDLETNITTEYSSIRKAAIALKSYAQKITDCYAAQLRSRKIKTN